VSGLVAVISRQPGEPVSAQESAALERVYEAMRGHTVQQALQAGNSAHVALLGRPERNDTAVVERRQGSWAVAAGAVHAEEALLDSPLENLDGAFALVRHDEELGRITAATDPFGMQHLYVAETAKRVYLSTSALVLAKYLNASPSAFDVFTYLRVGRNFGANTHWPAVQRLLPGTRLSVSNGKVERSRYWRPSLDDAIRRLPFDRAVEHCTEVAVETVRKYLCNGTGTWSDLTGGFDSRLLDVVLERAGVSFRANTVGSDHDRDVEIASRLAREAGWEWTCFQLPPNWHEILPKMLGCSLAWSDGHLDILQLSEVLWLHRAKSRTNASLLSGGGGEHFRQNAWQQEFLRAGRSNVVNWENWLRMRVLPPLRVPIFRTDRSGDVRAELRTRMQTWLEPYAGEPNTFQLDLLYTYRTVGHFGAYRSAAAAFLDAQLPFYFKPIFTAVTSTNFRFRNHSRLQRHLIAGLNRNLAAVETTSGGPAEPWRTWNLHRFAPFYGRIARKAVNKLSQKVTGRPVLPSRHAAGPVAARAAVMSHLETTADFHYDELRLAPLLRREGFEELVRGARNPAVGDADLLGRVITAELALRESDGTLKD
jgi:Glutamine amidotransferase domain